MSTISANLLLLATGAAAPWEDYQKIRLLLLPFIGAMLLSGGMIMLNPEPETRKIVIGRSIFSLLFGTIAPSLFGLIHPAIKDIVVEPAVLLAIGGATAAFVYSISRPLCAGMYRRAEHRAKVINEAADAKLEQKVREVAGVERETITIVKEAPSPKSKTQLLKERAEDE